MKLVTSLLLFAASFFTLVGCGDGERREARSAGVATQEANHDEAEGLRMADAELQEIKEFESTNGRKLGLLIYDEHGTLIPKAVTFPETMMSAKLCLLEGDKAPLTQVQAFVSCCDKKGIKDIVWVDLKNSCWEVKPVYCSNNKYRLIFTFGDGDTAQYRNKDYLAQ